MRKRKKKKTIGNSCLLFCSGLLLAAALAGPVANGQKSVSGAKPYALVAGTVFQSSGFVLRGAEVVVTPDPETKRRLKVKEARAVTDSRGEFAVRLPAAPGLYAVKARAAGFAEQQKRVSVATDERVDVVFQLEPKS